MTHTPDMSDLNEWMAGRVDKAEAVIRTAEVDGERYCHSEYGSANCVSIPYRKVARGRPRMRSSIPERCFHPL